MYLYILQVVDQIQGVLMPIQFMLTKYLESEQVLKTILQNLKQSEDGLFRSMVDGSIWQRKTEDMAEGIIVPLNIFFDDFTTVDTTSHHARTTSICGIYMSIPCLPSYLLGRISNILTVGFIKTEDRKAFPLERVLYKLIDTLSQLETTGINIIYDGTERNIRFVLGFVLGDNLGVNGILSFVECFRANYFCRICKRIRSQTETDYKEYGEFYRTKSNYEKDVQLAEVSQTGIKGPSIFNQIYPFTSPITSVLMLCMIC